MVVDVELEVAVATPQRRDDELDDGTTEHWRIDHDTPAASRNALAAQQPVKVSRSDDVLPLAVTGHF